MRRALGIGMGIVLCAGLVGCGGDEETADAPVTREVRVVEHAATDKVTDLEPMGDSNGDVLTFANDLYDSTNKTKVGTDQGFCVRTAAGVSWECMWTAFLADGQITVEGPFYDAKGSTLAITGGTGAYKDAKGEMQLVYRDPKGAEFDFVYSLILGE
jgi:hypothetical protein